VLEIRRGRSSWVGFSFLGIAIVLTIGTLFLALTDRSLADIADFNSGSADTSSPQSLDETAATATAEAEIELTPVVPDPLPDDLELSAQAAYVIHSESDTVLFERAADEPLQPASTSKIFTAMVVLEHASPEEVIEIVEEDVVDSEVESSMGLEAGDRVTVHDLLVGLLLASGNDAANALSRTIGARIDSGDADDSIDQRFVAGMNQKVDELGLEATVLKSPAGLDRDDQAVTARELAVAAEVLLERPSLATIVAMKRAEIRVGGENARVIELENTNDLLAHDGVYGIKTGTTGEAGQCLVVAYRNGESTTITVILGSEDRYGDARALLGLEPLPETDEGDGEDIDPEHTDPVRDDDHDEEAHVQ
jgi:serine-type D-Ala-D-Ala carboxypeptidase (penicillin-binding protein 5/6)